jgi:hypothetical protein
MKNKLKSKISEFLTGVKPDLPIGKEQIATATEILQRYKAGKVNLENRIIENEEWYKLQHWEQIRNKGGNVKENIVDPEPTSAWLFNSIANKHADAMDNYPEPNVLPRVKDDQRDAETLSKILPVVLEHNDFEETYNDVWWPKLKHGTGVYGVFWNNKLEDGLGDIDVKAIDVLNCFWQPGIKDIQKSRNFFHAELWDNEVLIEQYPQFDLKDKLTSPTLDIAKYNYDDAVDTSDSSIVVDWYYKKVITFTVGEEQISREVLHYCKYVNDVVLYASENDPIYKDTGYYEHGKYPFEFDVLFPEEGTPCGFGYIDIIKDPQMYIDKLNQIIITNAYDLSNPRYFAKDDIGINKTQFLDRKEKFVDFNGRLDESSLKKIEVSPVDRSVVEHLNSRIEELKETSGNRDFSQGGTNSGVTAASAIAALQEAGSKLSRDMNKASYRTYANICYLAIELIRQFYTEPRNFRITGANGGMEFTEFDNSGIKAIPQGQAFGVDLGYRRPVFDIKITPQRSSPFSKVANNELAKELFGLGAFNPAYADQVKPMLEMMSFDNKDIVMQAVTQNNQTMQLMMQMAQMIDLYRAEKGEMPVMSTFVAQKYGVAQPQAMASGGVIQTNPLGEAVKVSSNNTASKAQERASNVTKPR